MFAIIAVRASAYQEYQPVNIKANMILVSLGRVRKVVSPPFFNAIFSLHLIIHKSLMRTVVNGSNH